MINITLTCNAEILIPSCFQKLKYEFLKAYNVLLNQILKYLKVLDESFTGKSYHS
jgi:hypothetical protein